jgi:hypothetical protein
MIMPGTVGDDGLLEYQLFRSSFGYLYLLCLRHWLNPLLPKEILTSKRVNIFIINI